MEYSNILLIKMSSLGDIVHTLPFVAVLRKRFPQARITWLVHPQFAAFVPEAPLVDEILYFDKAKFRKMGWKARWSYFKEMRSQLRARKFDLVIDLQGLFKSAVLAAASGCANRIGYCEMREGSGMVSRAITGPHAHAHVIERYLDVARYLGAQVETIEFPLPDLTEEWHSVRKKLWQKLREAREKGQESPGQNRRVAVEEGRLPVTADSSPEALAAGNTSETAVPAYVVFVPGARFPTKLWPAENYAVLAGKMLAEGKQVVIAGSPEDADLGRKIKELNPAVTDLTGQTSLLELAALLQHCSLSVSGDTGPLFIATALKKPLIALYGPTPPYRSGPYGNKDAVIVIAPVPCAGCLKKHCDDWICMKAITPEMVYEEYKKKAGEGSGAES